MSAMVRSEIEGLSLRPGLKVIKASDYLAHVEAGDLVREAKERAEQMMADAGEERERERRKGYEEGMREATVRMTEQMMEVAAGAVEHLASVEKTLADAVPRLLRKMLGEVDAPRLTIGVVRDALKVHRDQQHISLRVAADMVGTVEKHLCSASQGYGFVDVTADPSLEPGQCVVESHLGTVEGDIDNQVEAIHRFLLRQFGQAELP